MLNGNLKRQLDNVDQVRSLLQKLAGDDAALHKTMLSSLPQFILVGAQSAGKSSVLRRITNNIVKLPVDSKRCTVVPTIIHLRRISGSEEPGERRVMLEDPEGNKTSVSIVPTEGQEGDDGSSAALTQAIKTAQDKALEESSGGVFAENYVIHVYVNDLEVPNVSLVDLPGFTILDAASENSVKTMVGRYLNMKGSLILHVVKGDQDFDTVLGNDYVRDQKISNKMLVLTHCDKLSPGDAEVRLQDIASKTLSPRFIILGSHEGSHDEEVKELKALDCLLERFGCEFDLGAKSLNERIEVSISSHLQKQLPLAAEELRKELDKIRVELEDLDCIVPVDIMLKMKTNLEAKFQCQKIELQNSTRALMEEMRGEIFGYKPFPVNDNLRSLNMTSDEIDVGMKVFYELKRDDYSGVTIMEIKEDRGTSHFRIRNNDSVDEFRDGVPLTDLFINDDTLESVLYIKKLMENRMLRNKAHMDPQLAIDEAAKKFSEFYTSVGLRYSDKMFRLSNSEEHNAFKVYGTVTEGTEVAFGRMEESYIKGLGDCLTRAKSQVQRFGSFNLPPLAFTINDHYLDTIYAGLIAKEVAADVNAEKTMVYRVKAYLKTQMKVVAECLAKELQLSFLVESEAMFLGIMKKALSSEMLDTVKVPEKRKVRRDTLQKRKGILEEALALLQRTW